MLVKPVNAVKNICKYTYNIVPKTYKAIEAGRASGEKFSREHGYGKTRTFCRKRLEVGKTLIKNTRPIEIPVILSAAALLTTPPGGSVVAFAAGCVLVSPVLVKKLLTRELSFKDIKAFMHNLLSPDYVKLDPSATDKIDKIKSFIKLHK